MASSYKESAYGLLVVATEGAWDPCSKAAIPFTASFARSASRPHLSSRLVSSCDFEVN